MSIPKIVEQDGYLSLFSGLEISVLLNSLLYICTEGKLFQQVNLDNNLVLDKHVIRDPLSFILSYLKQNGHAEIFSSFMAYTIVKILLNPLEIAKKKKQNHETKDNLFKISSDILKSKGIAGLYSGWYLTIPEAFCKILITHFALKLGENIVNKLLK
jgi:hypothetical protein